MILNCHDISKSYTGKSLFTGATFDINDKDKVALVGENGCGKTTLFRIILGLENADSGNVAFSKNVKTGYMAQIVSEKDESRSIFDILLSAKDEVIKLEESLREREKEIEALKEEGTDLNRISDVLTLYDTDTKRFEEMGGLTYLNEVYSVMHGLGFTDEDKDRALNELSGGQKTRVFLGNLLLQKPDILFLDEPTNHLDVNTLSFLEDYLKSYDRAVFVISHDRYFLDKIVNKVIDIDNEKVSVYTGNYSQYSEKKKEALKAMQKAYENDQQMRRHEEEVIKKLKSFNREKSIKRAESREKLLEKREVVEKPMTDDERMRLTFTPALRSGNDVLKVHDIKKSFGDNNLFEGLSFEIKRGEHVALIGDNGTGKSTILKLINGDLSLDDGRIRPGTNVMIGYYDQEHQVLSNEKSIFDEISDAYPFLTGTKIRNMLAAFLFKGDTVFTKIGSLSGGERGKVSLAKLMLSDANFLILDEPTNHLDFKSSEVLEDALNAYEGTVLYVSHDRYFINRTAHRIIELKDKRIYEFLGDYDHYIEKRDTVYAIDPVNKDSSEVKSNITDTVILKQDEDDRGKNDYQAQKEEKAKRKKLENTVKTLEEEIDKLEKGIEEIDEKMAHPDVCRDVCKLNELSKEKEVKEERLLTAYNEWEEANLQLTNL